MALLDVICFFVFILFVFIVIDRDGGPFSINPLDIGVRPR
jgi:hypothetical protein